MVETAIRTRSTFTDPLVHPNLPGSLGTPKCTGESWAKDYRGLPKETFDGPKEFDAPTCWPVACLAVVSDPSRLTQHRSAYNVRTHGTAWK